MRPARFAFAVIACAGGLGGAGCGPDLPERLWRSENVRYFSRAGDDSICPAIVDEIEEHDAVIADTLGIEPAIVSYYKFDGADDFQNNAECGAGSVGCAPNATVRSPNGFDTHELIHAYLAPYGRPPWLLLEGAAVALSCERYPRPTGSWRDAYAAARSSAELYGAGGWLVGYMLRMFRGTWLVNLYGSVDINATADEFARAFFGIYGMKLDDVWAAAMATPQAPMRCPWECGERPPVVLDGQPHPLSPVCGSGVVHRSVELPAGAVTRWRLDGGGRVLVRSCDGNDEPQDTLDAYSGPGVMLAPLGVGKYFVEGIIDPGTTPTLAASTGAVAELSSIDCVSAPDVAEDLAGLRHLILFYPSSLGPRYTRLATGAGRTDVFVSSDDRAATVDLCAGCATQPCSTSSVNTALEVAALSAGSVLTVPPGAAVTTTFFFVR